MALDSEFPFRSEEYLFSLDLYNFGFYWESHVGFEALWNKAGRTGFVADLLKALSQKRREKEQGALNNSSSEFPVKTENLTTFISHTLRNFSLSKERSQAVKRFPKLQQWLGKP